MTLTFSPLFILFLQKTTFVFRPQFFVVIGKCILLMICNVTATFTANASLVNFTRMDMPTHMPVTYNHHNVQGSRFLCWLPMLSSAPTCQRSAEWAHQLIHWLKMRSMAQRSIKKKTWEKQKFLDVHLWKRAGKVNRVINVGQWVKARVATPHAASSRCRYVAAWACADVGSQLSGLGEITLTGHAIDRTWSIRRRYRTPPALVICGQRVNLEKEFGHDFTFDFHRPIFLFPPPSRARDAQSTT